MIFLDEQIEFFLVVIVGFFLLGLVADMMDRNR